MSTESLALIALLDRAQASGATSVAALMEAFVYGNLKIEEPSLERETVVAVVRDDLRER